MTKTLVFLTICFAVLFTHSASAQTFTYDGSDNRLPFLKPGTTFLWPTNASDYLSATFAETRSAHFHAAIDVGTWGQRGFRVFATRDGILSRVGVSPTGYGNVIYLKHDDGSYSMYAHLQDFIAPIRRAVDERRFETYRFEFNENLEHLNMRFRQGELIGFTGDTGIGPPHLHFELRSPSNNPYNPLLVGITVADRVPPRFASLSVEPLSDDALINGRKQIARVPIRGDARRFEFGTIQAQGTIGLGVDVSDRADNMRNVYSVYELKLFVDENLYFHSRVDSFDFSHSRMMFLDRVYPILREHRRGYQRMYVRDGNPVSFYLDTGRQGTIRLPAGSYSVRIEASDFFGNTSIATGRIVMRDAPEPSWMNPMPLWSQNTSYSWGNRGLPSGLGDLFWTNDWFSNPSDRRTYNVTQVPVGSFNVQGRHTDRLGINGTVKTNEHALQRLTINNETMLLHRVSPGNLSVLRSPDQRLQLEIRPNTLYDTLSVAFTWYTNSNNRVIIETAPGHEPLRTAYLIRFLLDEHQAGQRNLGIYTVNANGTGFNFIGGTRRGNYIQATTTAFGRFTILADTIPPTVSRPRIWQRSDGKWFASVRVADDRSGTNHTTAEFYINGVRGIAEFDPSGGVLIYHHPDFRPTSRNQFRVLISDRSGNRTEELITVNR